MHGPVRFWTAADHLDTEVIDALTRGATDELRREGPASTQELIEQVIVEHQVSRAHLDHVLEQFYEREWRRQHRKQ